MNKKYKSILNYIDNNFNDFFCLWRDLTEIEAVSGKEANRINYIKNHLSNDKLKIYEGRTGSLFVEFGEGECEYLFDAHVDTVFDEGYSPEWKEVDGKVFAPGVGDNTLSVSSLIFLIRWLLETGYKRKIVFSFSTYEEKGDFLGIREALKRYPKCKNYVILEGHGLGRITVMGVGGARISFEIKGPGGHSWRSRLNTKSANHMLVDVLWRIKKKFGKNKKDFSYNFGVVKGGNAPNIISPYSYCEIDLRTLSDEKTKSLYTEIVKILEEEKKKYQLEYRIVDFKLRPSGVVKKTSSIVRKIKRVHKILGIESFWDSSTTNANIPMNLGYNSVCIGVGKGGGIHSYKEWIEIDSVKKGLAQLFLLIL